MNEELRLSYRRQSLRTAVAGLTDEAFATLRPGVRLGNMTLTLEDLQWLARDRRGETDASGRSEGQP